MNQSERKARKPIRKGRHLELHVQVLGLLALLHEPETESLEVDLMLGLLDDLPEQGPRGPQVVIFVGQQVLEHHGQELARDRPCGVLWTGAIQDRYPCHQPMSSSKPAISASQPSKKPSPDLFQENARPGSPRHKQVGQCGKGLWQTSQACPWASRVSPPWLSSLRAETASDFTCLATGSWKPVPVN